MVGARSPCTPLRLHSLARTPANFDTNSTSKEAPKAVPQGMAADGAPLIQSSPRTPFGPSENLSEPRPRASLERVCQKSCPERRLTASSNESSDKKSRSIEPIVLDCGIENQCSIK